jgi:hypothetical protein
MVDIVRPKFRLGQVVATPAALAALADAKSHPKLYLDRHVVGDWGDVDKNDSRRNDEDLREGGRLLSAYNLPTGVKIWIITESDRSATTVLLPDDY